MSESLLQSLFSQPTAILVLSAVVLFLFLSLMLLWLFAYRQKKLAHELEEHLYTLQSDVRALVSAAVGVGEKIFQFEKQMKQIAERQEQLDLSDSSSQPYQQAIKMSQKGASVSELIEICGLTRGEAELIAILHRMDNQDSD
jgi:hypothetical protein